jgi:hypothetical protein
MVQIFWNVGKLLESWFSMMVDQYELQNQFSFHLKDYLRNMSFRDFPFPAFPSSEPSTREALNKIY